MITVFSELEKDIENTCQEVRHCLNQAQRQTLMHLVDTQNLLREEIARAIRGGHGPQAGGWPLGEAHRHQA